MSVIDDTRLKELGKKTEAQGLYTYAAKQGAEYGANQVLNQIAANKAAQEAAVMNNMYNQQLEGLAAARANAPMYAANDELAYAKAMDAANYRAPVQPPYGAGVAPTGDVSTNGARLAPASDAQANVANQATQNWLDQYRKNKGQ